MTCQSTQGLILEDTFASDVNQMMKTDKDMPQSLEIKFGKTSGRAGRESRERSAEQLFADLELVASAVDGSDFGTAHKEEATGNQIWSSETRMLCMPTSPQVGDEFASSR